MRIIKLAAMLLAVCVLFSSCGVVKNENRRKEKDNRNSDGSEEELYKDLTLKDLKGYTYLILNTKTSSPASNLAAEEYTGDVIDDETVKRNLIVEEKINVKIMQERDTAENVYDKTVKSVLAGDGRYSAVFATPKKGAALAADGYILPLEDADGINTDKPWWYKNASEEASFDGEIYMLFGDIQLSYYDAHSIVGVNMNLALEAGLDNPYSLVEKGAWTLDKMFSLAKAVSVDLDGDGKRTYEDRYGVSSDGTEIIPMLLGAGERITESDEYGYPVLSCTGRESFYNTFIKIADAMYPKTSLPYVYDTVQNEKDSLSKSAMFKSKNVLFHVTDIGHLHSLRNVDFEFGLLPMPKSGESGKEYRSLISAESVTALCIPSLLKNPQAVFEVTENLCAQSHRKGSTKDNYLENILAFRYVNDEKSRKNLDTVLANGTFERAEIYDFGNVTKVLRELSKDADTYSSTMAKLSSDYDRDFAKRIGIEEKKN